MSTDVEREAQLTREIVEYGIDVPELLVFDTHKKLLVRVRLGEKTPGVYEGVGDILKTGEAKLARAYLRGRVYEVEVGEGGYAAGKLRMVSTRLLSGDMFNLTHLELK